MLHLYYTITQYAIQHSYDSVSVHSYDMYRVIQQVSDLSWVDSDFGCATACLILLGLMRVRQMHDEWNNQIKVNPTQVLDLLNHPVVCRCCVV